MKKTKILSFIGLSFLALLFCACNGSLTEQPLGIETDFSKVIQTPKLNKTKTIDKVIDRFVDEGHYPFLHVRLEYLDGSLMYEHSSVNKSLLPNFEVNKDSWIRIWSMSKLVTTTILLDLVEENFLELDDPITLYIPEFRNIKVAVTPDGKSLSKYTGSDKSTACAYELVDANNMMTVQHLLDHKAGFYYANTGFPCLDEKVASLNLPEAKSTREFVEKIATIPLIQHPGADYFYGLNTTLLGFVAERAAGKPLNQLVEEKINQKMRISGLQYGLADPSLMTPMFTGKDKTIREAKAGELDLMGPSFPIYDPNHKLYLGGEGMVATADGYADFLRIILAGGGDLLSRQTVESILAPHTELHSPYGYNGYNIWVASDSIRIHGTGDKGLWLGGGYEGTHYWVDSYRNFVGVIMSQMHEPQQEGYEKDNEIRKAIYEQIWRQEGQE